MLILQQQSNSKSHLKSQCLQNPGQGKFFVSRGCIVTALFCCEELPWNLRHNPAGEVQPSPLLSTTGIETCWQLSHLSDIPLILRAGWILGMPGAQKGSVPSSQLLPGDYAVISQLLQESEWVTNMAEGCCVSAVSVAGNIQSLFQFSLDSLQRMPAKCCNVSSGLCSKDAGWTAKAQSAAVLPVRTSSCCKEEMEEHTAPFCSQQQEDLVRSAVMFEYLLGHSIFFLSLRQKSLTEL